MNCSTDDLLIIGAGPAGLSAAINAASEGLTVRVMDSAPIMGGQARESNAIENYLGFPDGITGEKLMSQAIVQARKFGNIIFTCPANAIDISRDEQNNLIVVNTEDYQEFTSRAVLLANGLTYRRLAADNIGSVMGRGVYYGAPMSAMPTNSKCNIAIVGGANSAGQAAVKLAENKKATIKMYIRKRLDTQMSHYLVDRIRRTPNIEVCEGCTITSVKGDTWLTHLSYEQDLLPIRPNKGERETITRVDDVPTAYMFIFIGATPRTAWLRHAIQLDEGNYIVTGSGLINTKQPSILVTPEIAKSLVGTEVKQGDIVYGSPSDMQIVPAQRVPLFYESSMQGVFAAGDVRAHSTKRIAAAIGEGSAVVAMIHQYLASIK